MEPVNFLAHLHLADPDPGLMLGGIVADFARNPEIAVLPSSVQAGVRLHRLIDGFTDRHPMVLRSIARLSDRLGWFAGVVVDIYYDHLLARDWEQYSIEPLRAFADRAYTTLQQHLVGATPEAQEFIKTLIAKDLLIRYATLDGLAETLSRVSRAIALRIPKRAVTLTDALPDLALSEREFIHEFTHFYPELMTFARERRAVL